MSFQNKDNRIEIEPATINIKSLIGKIKKKNYVDNLLGSIYGGCLGDAYGLSTEFLNKKKIEELYPNKDEMIEFPDYITNRHNKRWDKGDWTDDTDQMILILQTFIECNNGKVDLKILANKLNQWVENGFKELGDQCGMGLGQTVGNVVYNEHFKNYPTLVSKSVWINAKKSMAANGSLMRTSIVSCMDFINEKQVLENTIDCCKLTHYDSRCIVCCVVFTKLISNILKEKLNKNGIETNNEDHIKIIDKIISDFDDKRIYEKLAKSHFDSNKMINSQQEKDEYLKLFNKYSVDAKEWSDLELDEPTSIGYVYKCFGSAIVTIRKYSQYFKEQQQSQQKPRPSILFRKVLDELIREGGDADTNGVVAGSLLGSIIGYSNLPEDMLLSLPNKSWLDNQVSEFIHLVDNRITKGTINEFSFNFEDNDINKINQSLEPYYIETDDNPSVNIEGEGDEKSNSGCIIQ